MYIDSIHYSERSRPQTSTLTIKALQVLQKSLNLPIWDIVLCRKYPKARRWHPQYSDWPTSLPLISAWPVILDRDPLSLSFRTRAQRIYDQIRQFVSCVRSGSLKLKEGAARANRGPSTPTRGRQTLCTFAPTRRPQAVTANASTTTT